MSEYCNSQSLGDAINEISFEDLIRFSEELLVSRCIEGFVGGNITESEAVQISELVQELISGTPCSEASVRSPSLLYRVKNRPRICSMNLELGGNALVWSCLVGKRTDSSRCGWELLSKLIKEPFYSELRTKQQVNVFHLDGIHRQFWSYASGQAPVTELRNSVEFI
jgi:insulysin